MKLDFPALLCLAVALGAVGGAGAQEFDCIIEAKQTVADSIREVYRWIL